jgi:type I restriction enzyme S subunit
MNAKRLLAHYEKIADAPDAILRLRRFILELAVRGKLVPQKPNDESLAKPLADARRNLEKQAESIGRMRWTTTDAVAPDEMEKDLPQGWVAARVNDTGLYINGLAFKPADWKRSGVPIIRIQNLTDPSKEFNYAEGNFPNEVLVREGDLLVSWSATLEAFKWERGDGVLNQHIFRVVPNEVLTTRDFLLLLLRNAIREMAESDHAHGLVMTHINRGPFLNHIVLIPPFAEQHRIVAKVDELMRLCDRLESAQGNREVVRDRLGLACLGCLNAPDPETFQSDARFALDALLALTTRPDQIKRLRQTILTLAVSGKLIEQDAAEEPVTDLLERMRCDAGQRTKKRDVVKLDLGKVEKPFEPPSGWIWATVQQTLDQDREISYGVIKLGDEPKDGGVPTLRCSDVRPGFIDLSGVRRVRESIESEYARTRLSGGEIVINVRGTLGGVALVPNELNGFNVAREVAVVPIAAEFCGRFFVYLMLSSFFWNKIQENLRGIAYKGLNLGILRDLLIPLPPLPEQYRIVAKVDVLMALCDRLEASLDLTAATRRRLLEALLAEALMPDGARELEAAE